MLIISARNALQNDHVPYQILFDVSKLSLFLNPLALWIFFVS
jgi:hypothetical protein